MTINVSPPQTPQVRMNASRRRPRIAGPDSSSRYSSTRGMTLIEILVVLVLMGIVVGIFIQRGEKAKRDAAKIEIGQIGQTLDLFKLEVGRYPTSQEGLQALIQQPSG